MVAPRGLAGPSGPAPLPSLYGQTGWTGGLTPILDASGNPPTAAEWQQAQAQWQQQYAPASSGGLSAELAAEFAALRAAVGKLVDAQANGPPALTMNNHISVPPDSNLGRSSPQVLAALARDVAAVLATRR